MLLGPSWGDGYDRISFNLVRHGEFQGPTSTGCPVLHSPLRRSAATPLQPSPFATLGSREPNSYRAPGYPLYLAAIFATFPESDLRTWDAACRDSCVPPATLGRRAVRVTAVLSAATLGGVFALTLFLGGSWMASIAAGAGLLLWYFRALDSYSLGMQDFLAAFLLLGHTAFAAIMWRRPRIVTGVSSGVALGLLALTKAVFQYWLVGIAVVLFTGLWLETDRRRTLLPACVALVLAALAVTTPWMARNAVEVGHFGISGRDGEVLAIRAEYGRMNWSEVPGAFAYWLREFPGIPAHTRALNSVRRWLEPETGYTNFDRDNPDGYYRRAKLMAGAVAARADQIDSEWWSSQVKCDSVLRQASVELMRVDWRKHVALTPAFAVRGAGAMGAGVLGLLVVPAFITVLLVAWKRRDMALALVMLPALYGFGIHAMATHFIPRYAYPLVPVALIVCALAADTAARSWQSKSKGGVVTERRVYGLRR